MPRKVHAPEDVVFLGPQFFATKIPDDGVIVLKPSYPRAFEADDPRTPAERYAINHAGVFRQLIEATHEAELPFDDLDFKAVKRNNPEHWERCECATTVILSNNGYFPPVYDQPVETVQPAAANIVPGPRTEEDTVSHFADLQQAA